MAGKVMKTFELMDGTMWKGLVKVVFALDTLGWLSN